MSRDNIKKNFQAFVQRKRLKKSPKKDFLNSRDKERALFTEEEDLRLNKSA